MVSAQTHPDEPHEVVLTADTLSGDESIELPEFDSPPSDPILLLQRWLSTASEWGVREPLAVSLATADTDGHPTSRIVLLKGLVAGGLVFTSHTGGRKGHQLVGMPWAAVNFYWRETLQQITVDGQVERLSDAASDALFAERPVAAQAATVVSQQSMPLIDEEDLRRRAQELVDANEPLDRPTGWAGYRLIPRHIEFWHGRASRLHRRLGYTWDVDRWTHQRLQP